MAILREPWPDQTQPGVAPIPPRVKPRLRGVFHELGFYAAVSLAVPLVLTAEPGRARAAATIFAACVAGCFGASALYHRPTWRPRMRSWLARLDHAGVYLLIAGTHPECDRRKSFTTRPRGSRP